MSRDLNKAVPRMRDFAIQLIGRPKEIPEAPFITDTNAWTKLGLKTALKEAVKQGAERIAN